MKERYLGERIKESSDHFCLLPVNSPGHSMNSLPLVHLVLIVDASTGLSIPACISRVRVACTFTATFSQLCP